MSEKRFEKPDMIGDTIRPDPHECTVNKTFLTGPPERVGQLSGSASMSFAVTGKLSDATAAAVSSAGPFFGHDDERDEWYEMFRQLARLDPPHLQVLTELKEPVIPKLEVLISWRPRHQSEATIRIAAAAVLSDKRGSEARSHARTIAWIGLAGTLLGVVAGFVLGQLTATCS